MTLLALMVTFQMSAVVLIIIMIVLRYKPDDSARKRLLSRINGVMSAICLVLVVLQTAVTVFYAEGPSWKNEAEP